MQVWVSVPWEGPWKLHFILNEIKALSSLIQVEFIHILCSANVMANNLAKQGVDPISPFVVFQM